MNNGGTTPPRRADEPDTSSDSTIPLERWNTDLFPWADYSDVTSMPSSSRNMGKAPMPAEDESEEEDDSPATSDDDAGAYEESDDGDAEDDDDDEEDDYDEDDE